MPVRRLVLLVVFPVWGRFQLHVRIVGAADLCCVLFRYLVSGGPISARVARTLDRYSRPVERCDFSIFQWRQGRPILAPLSIEVGCMQLSVLAENAGVTKQIFTCADYIWESEKSSHKNLIFRSDSDTSYTASIWVRADHIRIAMRASPGGGRKSRTRPQRGPFIARRYVSSSQGFTEGFVQAMGLECESDGGRGSRRHSSTRLDTQGSRKVLRELPGRL